MQGFIQRGGGGGGGGGPGISPPSRIPKVVTVLLINRYIVGIATGQTILKSTVKYIKVQLNYSKIRQFFSLIFLPIALKLGMVYNIVGVIPPILNPTSIGPPPPPAKKFCVKP